jgi:hypothetical protein
MSDAETPADKPAATPAEPPVVTRTSSVGGVMIQSDPPAEPGLSTPETRHAEAEAVRAKAAQEGNAQAQEDDEKKAEAVQHEPAPPHQAPEGEVA